MGILKIRASVFSRAIFCTGLCWLSVQAPVYAQCGYADYLKTYTLPGDSLFAEAIAPAPFGFSIIGKWCSDDGKQQDGFLMPLDVSDHVPWAKRYGSSVAGERLLFSRSLAGADGYFLVGRIIKDGSSLPSRSILVKTDLSGNLLWAKSILFDVSLYPAAELQIQQLAPGKNSDIVLCGSIYVNGFSSFEREGFVARLDGSGTIQFVRSFAAKNTNVNDVVGLNVSGNEIKLFGLVEDGLCSSNDPRSIYEMTLDYATATQLNIHRYCLPTLSGNASFADFRHNWQFYPVKNGFQLSGFLRSTPGDPNFLVMNLDPAGQFTNGFLVADPQLLPGYHNYLSLTNGDVLIQSAKKSGGALQSRYRSDGKLLNQFYYPVTGLYANDLLSEAGDLCVESGASVKYILTGINPSASINLFNRNPTAHTSSPCVGTDTVLPQSVSNLVLVANPLSWERVSDNPFQLVPQTLVTENLGVFEQLVCTDVYACSHLTITGPTEICPGDTDFVFHGTRDPGCGNKINWMMDDSWMSRLVATDDSTIKITALKTLHGGDKFLLKASLDVCEPGRDSLSIRLNCLIPPPDTVIIAPKPDSVTGVFFPNAFSPNGDGVNELFRPVISIPITNYNLQIYNRYGGLVFESRSPATGWNGTAHSAIQDQGIYVWQCHYEVNGKPVKRSGTLMLIH